MRRPKLRDQIVAERQNWSDAEREASLFANLSEVSPDVIKDLDMADYMAVQEVFTSFFALTESSIRRAVIILARYTSWSHTELMNFTAKN